MVFTFAARFNLDFVAAAAAQKRPSLAASMHMKTSEMPVTPAAP
jgi:hypothetical protein